jgi:ArsR family transcriptional regulator, lead/cadmium/zinc/bismuth-responsive transcriptional repressor
VSSDRCELLCLDLPQAEDLRSRRLGVAEAERLAGRAQALADPTRLILATALLESEELCVCDLSWISERSENLVSHHLRALRAQGLAHSRRDGKMVLYSLTDQARSLLGAVLAEAGEEVS